MTIKNFKKNINNLELSKTWFWILSTFLILNLFFYFYCVCGVVVDIVQRQTLENKITALDQNIISLESNYLKIKNNITLELAQELGFKVINNTKIVTRTDKNINLSLISSDF